MISNNGLVAIRKKEGETYITITEKGDDLHKNVAGSYCKAEYCKATCAELLTQINPLNWGGEKGITLA